MKVGIVSEQNIVKELDIIGDCDSIIMLKEKETTRESFYQLVKGNVKHQLILANRSVIPLQLIQLLPSFDLLVRDGAKLSFVEKGALEGLSDQAYFDELHSLAKMEKKVVKGRTKHSITMARENGSSIGRPPITGEQMERIYSMHHYEKKTIRRIAELCGVSVGTAYKYATQVRPVAEDSH